MRAYVELSAADEREPLDPADRERLALAAFLTGHEAESDAARERAHHDHLAHGDPDAAARTAFWLALALTLRGEGARGAGWFGRVQRVLDEAGLDSSVWHGYLLMSAGMNTIFGNDPVAAMSLFDRALAVADRHEDADLRALARHGRGQALVAQGDLVAGFAELDAVLVDVTTETLSPQVVGLVYCAVIDTCRATFDLRRGQEWTDLLSRWCAEQPDLVPYRGQCLVHRAEILQLHGAWGDAMQEVRHACRRLEDPPGQVAAGMALYQRGELHRLRGEVAEAESAYREASRCGHDPQPGLALLRLGQGDVPTATAAIGRALEEAAPPRLRTRLLPAAVEIALAAGELDRARAAAEELTALAAQHRAAQLEATALQATAAVLLSEDRPSDALPLLRRAWSVWQDVQAPYDAARTRVLVGEACRALGDDDTAEMELDAARAVFDRLGAVPDRDRAAALSRRRTLPETPGGLTTRELQVLRLVATGATNRAIAAELYLSERTVARHVANIFVKLDLSSRAAATAFAYEHHLV